jgi:hypothetical protein
MNRRLIEDVLFPLVLGFVMLAGRCYQHSFVAARGALDTIKLSAT